MSSKQTIPVSETMSKIDIEQTKEAVEKLEMECQKCIISHVNCGLYTPCDKCESGKKLQDLQADLRFMHH